MNLDQKQTQARNVISKVCSYPRTQANELVAKMTTGEVERIIRAQQPGQKPEEELAEVRKVLEDCQKRWETDAANAAAEVMKNQATLHAANKAPAPPAEDQVETPAEDPQDEPTPPAE